MGSVPARADSVPRGRRANKGSSSSGSSVLDAVYLPAPRRQVTPGVSVRRAFLVRLGDDGTIGVRLGFPGQTAMKPRALGC